MTYEEYLQNPNVKAFLLVIRKSEGTDAPDGYSYLFGSSPRNNIRFDSFEKHPGILQTFGKYTSTAAGAYQILKGIWLEIQGRLHFPDFSPHSQDLACIDLLRQAHALEPLLNDDLEGAVKVANKKWASLPGSIYGQPTHTMDQVKKWYEDAKNEKPA